MFLPQDRDLAPQRLVLLLHRRESRVQRLLSPVHVLNFVEDTRDGFGLGGCGFFRLHLLRVADLPLDVLEQVRMSLLKELVGELHFVLVELQAAVVDRGDFVESVPKVG